MITISNQTAVRIAIDPTCSEPKLNSTACGWLVLPPFGQRRVKIGEFAYQSWERFGLIMISEPDRGPRPRPEPPKPVPAWRTSLAWVLSIVLLGAALALLLLRLGWASQIDIYLLIGGLAKAAALVLCGVQLYRLLKAAPRGTWLHRCWLWLNRGWSLLSTYMLLWQRIPAIIMISVGVPVIAILFSPQTKGSKYEYNGLLHKLFVLVTDPMGFFSGLTDNPIELVLRLWLIVIAAMLPAFLLYLFHSQRLNTLRESFMRDVIRLSPYILTRRDASIMYGALMNDILGSTPGVISIFAQIPVLISTFLFAMGWTLTLIVNQVGVDTGEMLTPYRSALIFGFLGAYFFAINMIFRRYVRADLNSKAYTHMAVRVLVTFVLVWVISVMLQPAGNPTATTADAPQVAPTSSAAPAGQPPTAVPQPGAAAPPADTPVLNPPPVTRPETLQLAALYVLAFFVGIIPETATAVLQDFLRGQSWVGKFIPSLQEQHPLHKLDGITLYDQARLLEEGVENIETLAHHNLIELMLRTRIPAPRLVDLVDQAILYLHARGPIQADQVVSKAEESDDGLIYRLSTYGIRTATDLWQMYRPLTSHGAEHQDIYRPNPVLAKHFGEEQKAQLHLILRALEDDEWMQYLLHWRSMCQACQYTYRLQDFIDRFIQLPPPARWPSQPAHDSAGSPRGDEGAPAEPKPSNGNGRAVPQPAPGFEAQR